MAVFKQELNWSTYQDKQLHVLESLEKSFSKSLDVSKGIESNLHKLENSMDSIVKSSRSLAETTSNIYQRMSNHVRTFEKKTNEASQSMSTLVGNVGKVNEIYSHSGEVLVDFNKRAEEAAKQLEEKTREERERTSRLYTLEDEQERLAKQLKESKLKLSREEKEAVESNLSKLEDIIKRVKTGTAKDLGDAEKFARDARKFQQQTLDNAAEKQEEVNKQLDSFKKGLSTVISVFGKLGKEADTYSAISNQMIKISGRSGEAVQEFRGEVLSIVSDLNKETGFLYNGQESYRTVVATSQGVTSNLDAIEEMTKPLLLANETLDVSLNEIATIFNKFYTRYGFTSLEMEELVDDIRTNTAGNSATAEATLRNISLLENEIIAASKGDKEKILSSLKGVSEGTSLVESMNLDSGFYAEMARKLMSDAAHSDLQLLMLAEKVGSTTEELQGMMKSGDESQVAKVFELLVEAMSSYGKEISEGAVSEQVAEAFGFSYQQLMDAYAATSMKDLGVSVDEFRKSIQDNDEKSVEIAESKYVSAADKITNYTSLMYESLASIQENVGFGLSDVAKLLTNITSIILAIKAYSMLSGSGGGGSILGSTSGGGILGRLASSGHKMAGLAGGKAAALGAANFAGAGAGVALAVDGFSDTVAAFKGEKDAVTGTLGAAEGVAGVAGAGLLLASNPAGWAVLAGAGVIAFAKSMYESATSIGGAARAVEKAYEESADSILEQSAKQRDILVDIESGLNNYDKVIGDSIDDEQERTQAKRILENQKRALIESGILSEQDRKKLENQWSDSIEDNKKTLESLTEAYLKATDQWTEDTLADISKYQLEDMESTSALHKELDKTFKKWNDEDLLKDGTDYAKAFDAAKLSDYNYLKERAANGEEFDRATQAYYDVLEDAFSSGGKLNEEERDEIITEDYGMTGLRDDAYYESDIDVDQIKHAANIVASYIGYDNTTLDDSASKIHGADRATEAVSLANKALVAPTKEEAQKILDDLAAKGYHSSEFEEIDEAQKKWDLEGYAQGTNYIAHDQIAIVHEGEAITPKKYNPAANMNELETLRARLRADTSDYERNSEDRVSQQYMKSFVEILSEIREFLSYWREDNIKREAASEMRNRNSRNGAILSQYLLPDNY